MRKNLMLAAFLGLALAVPGAVRADDSASAKLGKDLSMTVGYKLWINTWETAIPNFQNSGSHVNAIVAGPVAASIPNLSLKYKDFLLSGSYLFTGDYNFPAYRDTFSNGTVSSDITFKASRTETDLNLGYFVTPNLIATVGYKNVEQKYTQTYQGQTFAPSKTHYNGVTLGIAGSAGIGSGFSMYGNAAGGLMGATYSPSSTHDTALYEASEVGFAWRAPSVPLSASVGYKFQYLTTRSGGVNAADVTRGYILGLNYTF
jgi:hypothetical protein